MSREVLQEGASRRLSSGFGLSAATIAVGMVGQLLAVPVLVSLWGIETYGEWLALSSVTAGIALLNLGLQGYVANLLTADFVAGNDEAGTVLLQATLRLYFLLCTVGVAAAVLVSVWPGLLPALGIKRLPPLYARGIVCIQGFTITGMLFYGFLVNLFRVIGQYPRRLLYGLAERASFASFPLGVAAMGGGPLPVAGLLFLVVCLLGLVAFGELRVRVPFTFGWTLARWRDAARLLPGSVSFMGVSASSVLLGSGTVIVVSWGLGPSNVVVYSAGLMMTNMVRTMINSGLTVVWPELTIMHASRSSGDRLARWHRLCHKAAWIVGAVAFCGITLLGVDVFRAWTAGKVPYNARLNGLLAMGLVVQVPSLVSLTFGLAINAHRAMLRPLLLTSAWTCICEVVGMRIAGLGGLVAGLAVGQLSWSAWSTVLSCRWTSEPPVSFCAEVVGRGTPAMAWALCASLLLSFLLPSMASRILATAIVVPSTIWLSWRTWLVASERHACITIAREFKQRLHLNGVEP